MILTRRLGIGLDDMFQYDMLARSLALGNGFRWYAPPDLARLARYVPVNIAALSLDPRGMLTSFRAPLYPAFLSLIYLINGINDGRFLAARLAQSVLGALLAPLTYFVARFYSSARSLDAAEVTTVERPASDKPARLAAWAVALYPMLLIFPLALATENLFFLLVLASFLPLLLLTRDSSARLTAIYALLAGVLLGMSALTRSVIMPFAVLAVAWIWLSLKKPRAALVALLALGATTAPWIVRNSLLYHQLTGIETSVGYNLYVGYYPGSTGSFAFGPSLDLLPILNDKQRDVVGIQRAMGFIRQDPSRVPYLVANRLGYFFDLELRGFTYFYTNNILGRLSPPVLIATLLALTLPFVLLSLSAAFGFTLLSPGPAAILLLLLFLAYLLPHVLILSEDRFHLVLIPFFAILAAQFWSSGFAGLRDRYRLLVSISILVACLLLLNWGLELHGDWHVLAQMLSAHGNELYLPY